MSSFHNIITVTNDYNNQRLDKVITGLVAGANFAAVQKAARKGDIKVNEKRTKQTSIKVVTGDKISIPKYLENAEPQTNLKNIKLSISNKEYDEIKSWIIEEDNDILVVNKPYGIPAQAGSGHTKSMDRLMESYVCFEHEKTAPKLVHRLDKNTTGCLLFAKKKTVAAALAEAFKTREMEKTYLAIVHGTPKELKGKINASIQKTGGRGHERMEVNENGQSALTEYKVLESIGRYSLVEVKPKTGRTHQIRVHMAHIGCPLVGDPKYGGQKHSQMFLHAKNITFLNPTTGKNKTCTAPVPPQFKSLMKE